MLIQSHSIHQMLANVLNSKGLYHSSGKEKESCCLVFPSWTKRDIRQFHIVIVQWRRRKVQTGMMHVQSFCVANLNGLLLFCRSRGCCRRHCLISLLTSLTKRRKSFFSRTPPCQRQLVTPPCETSWLNFCQRKIFYNDYCVFLSAE